MPLFENVPCPNCSRSLRLPADVIGSSVRCPLCQTTFTAARDGDVIETIPETIPPPPPAPSLSLDDDIPLAPLADDDTPEAPVAPHDDVEVIDAPPPPPSSKRRTAAAKKFTPVPFVVFVQRDPAGKLDGRYQAEVDANGVHLWRGKGRPITVERGAKANHKGGARVSLEIDGRLVDLTVIHGDGHADRLATQLVAFLRGERGDVELPSQSAVGLVPLLLLPAGIPVAAALFGHHIGGVAGTALWALFAAVLIGACCALAFGMRGGLVLRGVLVAVVVGFGYLALLVGFGVDWTLKARTPPTPPPAPAGAWQTLARPDQGFAVQMPGFVGAQNRNHPAFRDGAGWSAEVTTLPDNTRYQAIFGELRPNGIGGAPDLNFTEATLKAFVGVVVGEQRMAGPPSLREYRIVAPNPGKARLYLSPTRAVLLIATSRALGADHPDLLRFLDSVRFTGADWLGNAGGPGPAPAPPSVDPNDIAPGGRLLSAGPSFAWAGALSDSRVLGLKHDGNYLVWADDGRIAAERRVGAKATWGAAALHRPDYALLSGSKLVSFFDERNQMHMGLDADAGAGLLTCALSPDGATLATGHADQKVRLWDARTRKLTKTLDGPAASVMSLAFSADGTLLAAADGGEVRVFTPADGGVRKMKEKHGREVRAVCFLADGRRLASAGNDQKLIIWDGLSGEQLRTFNHSQPYTALAALPGGRIVFMGCGDGEIHAYDVVRGDLRGTINRGFNPARRPGAVRSLSVSADGQKLYAVTQLGVERWELSRALPMNFLDRQMPDRLPPPPTPGTLSGRLNRLVGGGPTLVAVQADGALRRLQVPSLHLTGDAGRAFNNRPEAAVSADGRTMAYTEAGMINVIDP
ncbi:MAG: hypothetical protein ACRC33_09985, partial [Gemmataceae bacterium]